MLIRANAKINWTLDTVGVRADGYHLLDMLMQSISLHDTLTLEPAEDVTFSADGATRVPQDEGNLALRAALALRRHAGTAQGAMIHLHKRIPSGAGLGGGSADAAAVLHGLNALWELNLPMETLRQIGLTLGADVPFCLMGGLAHVRGIDSSTLVNTLVERGLLEEGERLDLPGKPIAYRTTPAFLRCFGLSSLDDLPPLPEIPVPEQTD